MYSFDEFESLKKWLVLPLPTCRFLILAIKIYLIGRDQVKWALTTIKINDLSITIRTTEQVTFQSRPVPRLKCFKTLIISEQ